MNVMTPRQQQIVELLCQGLSNKEIARALGINHSTVKVHLYDIAQRMGTKSRGKLVHLLTVQRKALTEPSK